MVDLVQWLNAQLDADERIAREATGEEWGVVVPSQPYAIWDVAAFRANKTLEHVGRLAAVERAEDRAHIAAHDPARVLREIDAKRRIMECHEPWTASSGDTICGRCGREHIDGRPGGHFPCQTLRLLALPYADRPGNREEWRP